MLSSLSLLLALAAQPAAPPGGPPPLPSADPPPTTIQEAIDRCELLEHPKPRETLKVVDYGLALDEAPSPAQRGLLLACRAGAQIGLGQMDAARALTLEIDPLARQGGEPRDRVGLMIRLAQLHFRGGDPITALEVMDDALKFTEAEQLDEDLPQVLGNLAILLTESGQFAPAVEHFQRILAVAESEAQAGNPPTIPLVPVRFNLSRALLFDERPDEALPHLEWLAEAMTLPGMAPRRATALSMLAMAHSGLGDDERAAEVMAEAEALHETFDNPGERSSLRRDQAVLARDRGDLESAEAYGREALELSRVIQYDRAILDSQKLLVDILAQRGKYEEALELHREYAALNQEFLEDTQRSRLDLLETRLGVQRQAAELDELRQTAELQDLRLEQESFRRQVAWASLIAVLVIATLLVLWQLAHQKRLLRISRTDSLTGMANRRYLTLQIQQSGEDIDKAALMLLDLDRFKTINDQHGHDVGDLVLVEVSRSIDRLATEHDAICGRWGGEEFAVFLPGSDAESARQLAETLRLEIEALEIEDGDGNPVPVTTSIGFAPIHGLERDSGQDVWEPALKCADLLLYRAKHAGRNQGFGAWPASREVSINPLALDEALKTGAFRLLVVPGPVSG